LIQIHKILSAGIVVALVAALAVTQVGSESATATHTPANKVSVSGAALEVMTTDVTEGSVSDVHTILKGKLRSSGPTDLILQVTAECALWTYVTTVGNAESEAIASVKVWVEIDGVPVTVAGDDTGEEAGKVVFCNRAYRMETLQFDDEDATIKQYLKTRSANAFNWVSLNVGSGVHEITVKAQLEGSVSGTGMAKAAIGKRTLVVEPTKLANDVTI